MADPIAEIEVELKRPVATVQDANKQRKNLNRSFQSLTPDQAATLLRRLLTWDGSSRLPEDFRRPDRAIRLELMLVLVQQLGTQTAQQFLTDLKGDGKRSPDPKLVQGLKMVFPDAAKTERDKFLDALKAGPQPPSKPMVQLEFRNSGKFSLDNQTPSLKFRLPEESNDLDVLLRLGPSPANGTNKMEIRGTIIGHRPGNAYRFDRTIEKRRWYLVGNRWKPLKDDVPGGSNDNKHTNDEDDVPNNDHIYSIDTPGLLGPIALPNVISNLPGDDRKDATEVVFMMNATESVEVKVGTGPFTQSATLNWFSVSWIEKVGANWRRKADLNRIGAGSIQDLEFATEPPRTF